MCIFPPITHVKNIKIIYFCNYSMLILSEKLFRLEDDVIKLACYDDKTYSLKDIWCMLPINSSLINELNLQILDFLNTLFLFNKYDDPNFKLIEKIDIIEKFCKKQLSIRFNKIKNSKQLCLIQFLLILFTVMKF